VRGSGHLSPSPPCQSPLFLITALRVTYFSRVRPFFVIYKEEHLPRLLFGYTHISTHSPHSWPRGDHQQVGGIYQHPLPFQQATLYPGSLVDFWNQKKAHRVTPVPPRRAPAHPVLMLTACPKTNPNKRALESDGFWAERLLTITCYVLEKRRKATPQSFPARNSFISSRF